MDWLSAIILGIIQGLSEFLPVSSSGHLELGRGLLGIEVSGSSGLLFTVTVHAATALATVVVFYKDIVSVVQGLIKGHEEDRRFAGSILVSMIPAAFVGLLFEDAIEGLFEDSTLLVGAMLIITGLLLLMADRAKKNPQKGFGCRCIRCGDCAGHCHSSWNFPKRSHHQHQRFAGH